jgi:6-phosphogluconolactonase
VSNAGFIATPSGVPPNPFDPAQFIGSASSYDVSSSGVTATSNALANGRAACWLVVTGDNRHAFTTNTLSDTIPNIFTGTNAVAEFKIARDGTLTLIGNASSGPGTPTDEALSEDSRYLYVTNPTGPAGPNTSHIDVFKVGHGGSLRLIESTPEGLPPGISGAAAH